MLEILITTQIINVMVPLFVQSRGRQGTGRLSNNSTSFVLFSDKNCPAEDRKLEDFRIFLLPLFLFLDKNW
ncbi:hypothetical protein CEXT_294311 [Caerostris extrusa]|uniref:Ycf15 n=1 Tax=Caerostris extrusa TaxID=172846 RepID=A0AAV4SZP9_CAEEX|nr:hypothetical protein CEXT_294311 [Caerostris extrusa]